MEGDDKTSEDVSSESGAEDVDAEETFATVLSRLIPFISRPSGNSDILQLSCCSESCNFMFNETFLNLVHTNQRLIEGNFSSVSVPFLDTQDRMLLSAASYMHYLRFSHAHV